MELTSDTPRRRKMDTSNGEARQAIKETLKEFEEWRLDLARFSVLVERNSSDREKCQPVLARCAEIEREVHETRIGLLDSFVGAPARVAHHSRVIDVERALDNIDMAIAKLRGRLLG